VTTYQPYPGGRWLASAVALIFGLIFGAASIALVVAVVRGQGPPVAFAVFWLAAVGWNAYWWLGRMCIAVDVGAANLVWRTPLRAGRASLKDVTTVRPSRLSRQFAVIEVEHRRGLVVPIRYGFGQFTDHLRAGAPQVRVLDR
jgi:hypothetical protein